MDIYSNPKQKQKDHVPEEFLCESSSDKSSDEWWRGTSTSKNGGRSHSTNTRTIRQPKKTGKGRKIPQNQHQPPYNKQPRQERLAAPRPPNPKPSTSSGLLRTPPNTSSQEQRRPSISAEFKWTAPNTSPQEKRRPPPAKFCLPLSCSFLQKQFIEPSDWFTACNSWWSSICGKWS